MLRIGGGSTDIQRDVPDKAVWDTLRQLNSEMGEGRVGTRRTTQLASAAVGRSRLCCALCVQARLTSRPLHLAGANFILGVNFMAGVWNVTKAQVDAVRRELPWSSVRAIELGNEVRRAWPACWLVRMHALASIAL